MPETNMPDNNKKMEKHFKTLVSNLKKAGADLKDMPAVFKWDYPDDPNIVYQLVIFEVSDEDKELLEETKTTLH